MSDIRKYANTKVYKNEHTGEVCINVVMYGNTHYTISLPLNTARFVSDSIADLIKHSHSINSDNASVLRV
jgi:hypothetical protein